MNHFLRPQPPFAWQGGQENVASSTAIFTRKQLVLTGLLVFTMITANAQLAGLFMSRALRPGDGERISTTLSKPQPVASNVVLTSGANGEETGARPAMASATVKGSVLDQYVELAISQNLVLQQRNVDLEKAMLALKDAQKVFLPSVALNAGYLSGTGGRYIDLPVGDLLNPVYGTLNQLTQSQNFPTIPNVRTYFFPTDQYDAHLRTSMPLLNPDIKANKLIKDKQLRLQQHEAELYERELVRNVKISYYNYLSAVQGVKAYQSALALANRGLETSESLVRNGKAVPATIARIRAEVERIQSQITEAQTGADNAKRYLNFLLNRDLSTALDTAFNEELTLAAIAVQNSNEAQVNNREELKQLALGVGINEDLTKQASNYWVPRVSTFLDLGNQSANGFRVDANSPYILFGLNVDMPVWNANRNKLKVMMQELSLKNSQLSQTQTIQALNMAAQVASANLKAAYANLNAARRQLSSAHSYHHLIDAGYRNGTNSILELVDAQNQVTVATTQLNLSVYKVLQAAANLERETATAPLTSSKQVKN